MKATAVRGLPCLIHLTPLNEGHCFQASREGEPQTCAEVHAFHGPRRQLLANPYVCRRRVDPSLARLECRLGSPVALETLFFTKRSWGVTPAPPFLQDEDALARALRTRQFLPSLRFCTAAQPALVFHHFIASVLLALGTVFGARHVAVNGQHRTYLPRTSLLVGAERKPKVCSEKGDKAKGSKARAAGGSEPAAPKERAARRGENIPARQPSAETPWETS